jgi:hypothetical protein
MASEKDRIAAELRRHGDRRRRGLETAQAELDAIGALLPEALDAGLSKFDIHRLTGVGRPTIDSLLRRRDEAG